MLSAFFPSFVVASGLPLAVADCRLLYEPHSPGESEQFLLSVYLFEQRECQVVASDPVAVFLFPPQLLQGSLFAPGQVPDAFSVHPSQLLQERGSWSSWVYHPHHSHLSQCSHTPCG